MPINLCAECYLLGACRLLQSRVVTEAELTPQFLRAFRAYVRAKAISRHQWLAYLDDAYRDYPGTIIDADGHEVSLDMSVFERPNIRDWFRDLCRPLQPDIQPRLRRQAVGRYIAMATILRAVDPVAAMVWGMDVANDTDGPGQTGSAAASGCRYRHFAYRAW